MYAFRESGPVGGEATVNSTEATVARPREAIATPGSPYIPSLDGIRAISFLIVFVAHAGLGHLVPGAFGVTVFFLLSGYLITTLLRMEFARSGRISLGGFYLRRVLRILPPLYIALALAIVLFRRAYPAEEIPFWGTMTQALQVSNFYQIYASPAVTIPGSGVLWSLAVEEHFYLLFPLLYVGLCSRFTAGRQAGILIALCAGALVWRCVLRFHFELDSVRTFYGTDTRFDSILFGCVFAIIANPVFDDPLYRRLLRWMRWLLPLAAALLIATFVYRNEGFRETFRYTLQAIALVPLFIAAIHYQSSWPARFLNQPFVRFVGVLSYTLYLCHSMILEFLLVAWPTDLVTRGAAALLASFLFALLVHYAVERPCASLRKRLSSTAKPRQ
jgi:peptidoglycan/LPS O-acetylase OafA/YrhL